MKHTTLPLAAMLLAIAALWFFGCDDDDHGPMHGDNISQSPQIVSVFPEDNATDVSTTASISIKFDSPMDTSSVMDGFHYSGGLQMHDWMDTLEHYSSMGMMDMNHMMNWMDSIEHHGQFHWSENMDSCEFVPDSPMEPDTEYMILIYGNIRSYNGMLMDMHHLDYDGYMYHFQTGQ